MMRIVTRLFAAGLLAAMGCNAYTGSVSGTITYKGEKVASGTVSFLSQGRVVEADIHDGTYHVEGVPPGEAIVTVVRPDSGQPDPLLAATLARKQSAENKTKKINVAECDPGRLALLQKKRQLLPDVYSSPQTSDLHFMVAAGANGYDIHLLEQPNYRPSD